MMTRAEESPERYSMTTLLRFNPEFMWGPLLRLNYPELLRFGVVSRDAKAIVDDETFWKLKARWDFEAEYERPKLMAFRRTWKKEYKALFTKVSNRLLFEAEAGNLERLRELLDLGVDVDRRSCCRNTPLISASGRGEIDVVRELLKRGADVNARSIYGFTALFLASRHGYAEIVEMLTEAGAEIELQNGDNWTPLMEASKNGKVESVRVLLAENADVNAQTVDGYTALRIADNCGKTEIVEILLAAGADPDIQPQKLSY